MTMYIDVDSHFKFHLMDMNNEEVQALIDMIRGANLQVRRTFNGVLHDLKRIGIDKLQDKCEKRRTCPATGMTDVGRS